jgi:hypothetical protein
MRFLAPRVSDAFPLRGFGDAAARVIRGRFLSGLRTGPAPECYRDLAGTVKVPATSMGFTYRPSQFCFRPRVTASFDVSRPRAVSPPTAASFIVAGSTAGGGGPRVCGCGSWGLAPPERTVPCDLPAPL